MKASAQNISEAANLAIDEGLILEMIISEVNLNDWDKFIHYIKHQHFSEYWINGKRSNPPQAITDSLFNNSALLKITVNKIVIESHFYAKDEIELNIDPSLLKKILRAEKLLGFMDDMKQVLGKEITLRIEGAKKIIHRF
jgi:hypothetical protein